MGILLIESFAADQAAEELARQYFEAFLEGIGKITPLPIRYVIVGADHADRIAGNGAFASSVRFIAHPDSKAAIEELASFRRALENLVSEGRRLYAAGVPHRTAYRNINLGEFQYWYRAANNMPDGLRKVYAEEDERKRKQAQARVI